MSNSPIPTIYLLGAGRSGTTIMAALMNTHTNIHTAGELHQFFSHLRGDKNCSCGQPLANCPFWSPIVSAINQSEESGADVISFLNKKEAHRNILKFLLFGSRDKRYNDIQSDLFGKIRSHTDSNSWILDSSKYLARYLLLKKNNDLDIRGIYMVRDVRGVIYSFSKKVQSSRSPLSALIYYCLINFFAQWICWTDNRVIKVRYEDLMAKPEQTLSGIYKKVLGESPEENLVPEEFDMPHIVGGNRMRSKQRIKLELDEKWRQKIPRSKQILYYILAFPLMWINKYSI